VIPFPIAPQLAKLEPALPRGDGWVYEPKWDGFRAILFKERRRVRVQSRNGKDLAHRFPEVVRAATSLPDCVVDGELVAVVNGRLEFEGLISRLDGGVSSPPAFIAFDLLSWLDEDLRSRSFGNRRRRLEEIVTSAFIQTTQQTPDIEAAEQWLQESFTYGFEGVVAKKTSMPYMAGQRSMVKVKHYESCDVVVGGYTGSKDEPRGLIVGLYDAACRLHHVGTTSALGETDRAKALQLKTSENHFTGQQPGLTRWQSHRFEEWIPVEAEMVCEIAFNRLDGTKFRHSVRFLRWRPDRDPLSCTYDQLARLMSSSAPV
jgi:ATP-dependent DNA ligase